MSEKKDDILIKVDSLKTYFPITKGLFSRVVGSVKAVDGVSFTIPVGKTLGLVGESGCGKTTVGRSILRLIPHTSGRVEFDSKDIFSLSKDQMQRVRKDMQIIFQDPYGSLNPRMTVENIVGESLGVHGLIEPNRRRDRVVELLEMSGLSGSCLNRYAHEFSGGQRQRIGIARALALEPKFIVCDEPVSALDVSIQSQIVNLLQDLQQQMGLTYLFIAHDLAVVEHISDFVAVMYLGKIVEITTAKKLFSNAKHPYTKALMSAIPQPNPNRVVNRTILKGEVPSPSNPPSGCAFHPRCPIAEDACRHNQQKLESKDDSGEHLVACWKA